MTGPGHWLTPAEAAPLLGRTTRQVRELCQDQQIDHQRIESPSGSKYRYLISEAAIAGFLHRNTIRAVA
jgi:hypothetical protein